MIVEKKHEDVEDKELNTLVDGYLKRSDDLKSAIDDAFIALKKIQALASGEGVQKAFQNVYVDWVFPSEDSDKFMKRNKRNFKGILSQSLWLEFFKDISKCYGLTAPEMLKHYYEYADKRIVFEVEEINCLLSSFSILYPKGQVYTKKFIDLFKLAAGIKTRNVSFKIGTRLIFTNISKNSNKVFATEWQKNNFRQFLKYIYHIDNRYNHFLNDETDPVAIVSGMKSGESHEFPWFDVKVYGSGNIHVSLKNNERLIDKINSKIETYFRQKHY